MYGSTRAAGALFAALLLVSGTVGAQSGALTVYKTFEPASLGSGLPPGATFAVKVVCTPGSTTVLQLSAANQFKQTISGIAVGSTCGLMEMTPVNAEPPRPCRWVKPAFPKGQSVVIPNGESSLIVQNSVDCREQKTTDVRLEKVGGGSITLGATATFYLRPGNLGPGAIGTGNITVVDTLPPMFGAPITAGALGWSCGVVGRVVTCHWTGGNIAAQTSMPQIIVTAVATSVGVAENCGWARLNGVTDTQLANNGSCVGVTVSAPKPRPTLTVNKILLPATDPLKVTLTIDGVLRSGAVGTGGSTGPVQLTAGAHTVGEVLVAGPQIHASNYTTVIGGDCTAAGAVTLADGDNKVCTITNTRRAQLKVVKKFVPANATGMFTLMIDGQLVGDAFGPGVNVGHNGTTGFVTVDAGQRYVSEGGGFSGPGDQSYVASFSANCAGGMITLQPGSSETCTITNTKVHGVWEQGPGTYTVSICSTGGCTITGTPGQQLAITFEVWGAGGGGGRGQPATPSHGGNGGGGGGGGGYGKVTTTVTVPTGVGGVNYWVLVGAGGAGGVPPVGPATAAGRPGGFSEIRLGSASGTIVLKATGGGGGHQGHTGGGTPSGSPGAGGNVTISSGSANNAVGLPGTNGAMVTGCNGGEGGTGGIGGGPGAINSGGKGGHGGYYNAGAWLAGGCTSQSMNNGLSDGAAGGPGKVRISW